MPLCDGLKETTEIMAKDELSTGADHRSEVSKQETHGICTNSLAELHRCGDALFAASESLLDRVQRDDSSPYAASVSRIHHLAATLRERLIEVEPGTSPSKDLVAGLIAEQNRIDSEPIIIDEDTVNSSALLDVPIHIALAEIADPAVSPTQRPPRVLVIDESPFIRMLLSLAIETAGYAALTLASLEEAEDQLNDSQGSDIVIWGGVASATQTDCLTEWLLRRDDSRRPMLIGLVNGKQSLDDQSVQFDQITCRTHLPELLSVIRNKLGGPQATRKTA